jgi:hypothetical protein
MRLTLTIPVRWPEVYSQSSRLATTPSSPPDAPSRIQRRACSMSVVAGESATRLLPLHWQSNPELQAASNFHLKTYETTCNLRGEVIMIERKLTVLQIGLIAATRVALGIGIGLLVSGRLRSRQRRRAGLALTLVGGLTTIPLVISVVGQKSQSREDALRVA